MREHARNAERGEGAFKALIGIAIFVVVVIAAIKIIPLHMHGGEILDAMNEQANFGSLKSMDKIQYEVFRKAQEADVPLALNDIKVYRTGSNIVVQAKYDQSVDVLGYKYVYHFDNKVEKPTF